MGRTLRLYSVPDARPDFVHIEPLALKTLLVTNDFPPKLGGIQSYLFGLLSTLEPSGVRVMALDYPGAGEFDAARPYEVFRVAASRLYPTRRLLRRICDLAAGMDVVQFGYALQSWTMAPAMRSRTGVPYVVFVHGAEVLMPLRVPGTARLLKRGTLDQAAEVLAVSGHTAAGIKRYTRGSPPCTVVPPTVDPIRFDLPDEERLRVRKRHGLGSSPTILCVGRLTAAKARTAL